MENCLANARLLSKSLEATGWYICVSDIHRKKGVFDYQGSNDSWSKENETSADFNAGLPVVAFRLSDSFKKEYPHVKQDSVSNLLRAKQYIIPNYPLPPNEDSLEILRVVVRESMSFDLLDRLITDICATTEQLMESDEVDLAPFQFHPGSKPQGKGEKKKEHKGHGRGGNKPMSEGVHRSVC